MERSRQRELESLGHLELENVRSMCLTFKEAAVLEAFMFPFAETPCCIEIVKE